MEMTLPVASYHPNPLDPIAGRALSFVPFLPDETVAEYIDRQGWDDIIDRPSKVFLDGKFLSRPEWLEVVPQAGQRLSAHAALSDGESDIGRVLLQIGILALAVWTGGIATAAWGPVGGVLASTAVSIGGNLLLNQIMPMPTNDRAESKTDPTYSLSGGSNNLRPYEPLPWPMGVLKMYPDIDERPFTFFSDEDQFLHQCFNFGLGNLALSELKIGETAVSDLGVTKLVFGQTAVTNIDTAEGNALTFATGNVVRTSPVDTVEISVDVGGVLVGYNSKGEPSNGTADFVVEYSPHGAGTWSPFNPGDTVIGYTPDNWEEEPATDPDTPPPLGASSVPWTLTDFDASIAQGG